MKFWASTTAVLIAVGTASTAFAQAGTGGSITDNNATFTIADYLGSGTGNGPLADFRVGGTGNPDHLFQAWWWYRVEGVDTREFAFNGASSADWSIPGTGRINYSYANFDAVMEFQVTGTSDGVGVLTQTLTIINNTNDNMTINLFNYQDVDLGGTAGNDSAFLAGPNVIRITDAAPSDWIANYEGTNDYGVAGFAALRARLTDNNPDNFSGTGLPFGPGDFTGGFQWVLNLSPGSAATASATLTIIPSPGAMALLGLGGLVGLRRRRN